MCAWLLPLAEVRTLLFDRSSGFANGFRLVVTATQLVGPPSGTRPHCMPRGHMHSYHARKSHKVGRLKMAEC